jgi:hypothetical protein
MRYLAGFACTSCEALPCAFCAGPMARKLPHPTRRHHLLLLHPRSVVPRCTQKSPAQMYHGQVSPPTAVSHIYTHLCKHSHFLNSPLMSPLWRPGLLSCRSARLPLTGACLCAGWFATLSSAPGPPPTAASNAGGGTAPSAPAVANTPAANQNGKQPEVAQHTDFDDDDGLCVVCMEHPCEAGFLHGDR